MHPAQHPGGAAELGGELAVESRMSGAQPQQLAQRAHDGALELGGDLVGRLVSEVLDSGAEVDALLCFNDRLAMGAYQALQERGVRVPEDVSVLSFDDTSFARWLRPGLTTFAFPQRALGRAAADELIDLIERGAATDGSSPPPAHLVPLPLRMRSSVTDRT